MIFNNYLHYIRTKLKLPIKEAAASANVSVIKLRAWEAGRSKPNISSILKLERAYKLPYGTLLNCLNGTTEKKRIYISHPLRNGKSGNELIAEINHNRKEVSQICEDILKKHDDVLILSPIHAFGFLSPLGEQTQSFNQCKALLELADELWVYGDWHSSEGCQIEIQHAEILKIPIRYF